MTVKKRKVGNFANESYEKIYKKRDLQLMQQLQQLMRITLNYLATVTCEILCTIAVPVHVVV